jgi:hypothetical protein
MLAWPNALLFLMDDVSASRNGFFAQISFFVLVVWLLVIIRGLLRARPLVSD